MRKKYLLLLAYLFAIMQISFSQPNIFGTAWVPNGSVDVSTISGGTIYIGGTFTCLSPNKPFGSVVNSSTGSKIAGSLSPNGVVLVSVPDGSNGWYIGGTFTEINGVTRNRLARINSDGSLHSWDPNVTNGEVRSIFLSGTTIYVGGTFTTVNGATARNRIAALDATTGIATSWNPAVGNGSVNSIIVYGNTVYIGGSFTSVSAGGITPYNYSSRNYMASVSSIGSGALNSFNPSDITGTIFSMALNSNGSSIYVGGEFSNSTQGIANVAEIYTASGSLNTSWRPKPNGPVRTVTLGGTTLYIGGFFTNILIGSSTNNARGNIAAFDIPSETPKSWNPVTNDFVHSIVVSGNTVYAGGEFTTIGNPAVSRHLTAAFDANTGSVISAWSPGACGDSVKTISLSGNNLYIGGGYNGVEGEIRNRIASLNAATGELTSWNPNANNSVTGLFVDGSTVYVGGNFTNISGQNRNRAAAIDASTASATSWNPNLGGSVRAFAVNPNTNTVYLGGSFTTINGNTSSNSRRGLAEVDNVNGTITSWDPSTSSSTIINSMILIGNTLYVGGEFTVMGVGGPSRSRIAALDVVTGNATAWNPNAAGTVETMIKSGGLIYVGGSFSSIGGVSQKGVAAIDINTGTSSSWRPTLNSGTATIKAIAVNNGNVYIGGDFSSVQNQARNRIASLDATTGAVNSWNPNADGVVNTISTHADVLTVGGAFKSLSNVSGKNFLSVFAGAPLPVTWLSFIGKKVTRGVELNWSTSTEQNTADFEVQHSINAQQWNAIGTLSAAGNSNTVRNYRYLHEGPFKSSINHFYRILQRDLDGKFSYSKVISIEYPPLSNDVLVFPNPASDVINVNLAERQELRLVNMQGVVVWKGVLPAGRHEIPVSHIATGSYILQAGKGTYKVMIQ